MKSRQLAMSTRKEITNLWFVIFISKTSSSKVDTLLVRFYKSKKNSTSDINRTKLRGYIVFGVHLRYSDVQLIVLLSRKYKHLFVNIMNERH